MIGGHSFQAAPLIWVTEHLLLSLVHQKALQKFVSLEFTNSIGAIRWLLFCMIFYLSPEERELALQEASRRQGVNEQHNASGRNGGASRGSLALFYHRVGAAGEVAVATYLGLKDYLFKDKSPIRGSYDLPWNIDVKTRTKHNYDLIVQLDDRPDKIYWLVTIENKSIIIHGWIPHEECIKDKYIKDPAGGRKAYFVPKEILYAPESFDRDGKN